MCANSTYWEAKVRKEGLVDEEEFREGKKGGFWGMVILDF